VVARHPQEVILAHIWPMSIYVLGVVMVTVQRADARPERQAILALQVATVALVPPAGKRTLGPVCVTAILAREAMCSEGQEPVQ